MRSRTVWVRTAYGDDRQVNAFEMVVEASGVLAFYDEAGVTVAIFAAGQWASAVVAAYAVPA